MSKKNKEVEKKTKKQETPVKETVPTQESGPVEDKEGQESEVVLGEETSTDGEEPKDETVAVAPLKTEPATAKSGAPVNAPISVLINVRSYAANMAGNRPVTPAQCAVQQELLLSSLVKIVSMPLSSGAMAGLYEILADSDNTAFAPRLITRALADTSFDERKRAAFVLLTTTLVSIATTEKVSIEWDALEVALSAAGYQGETLVATIRDSAVR